MVQVGCRFTVMVLPMSHILSCIVIRNICYVGVVIFGAEVWLLMTRSPSVKLRTYTAGALAHWNLKLNVFVARTVPSKTDFDLAGSLGQRGIFTVRLCK